MNYSKGKCTCQVVHLEYGETEIEYCPLHEVAPEMYEALGAFVAIMEIPYEKFEDFELAMKPIVAQMQKAKAKAEGGK